jgi:hypothetical protein
VNHKRVQRIWREEGLRVPVQPSKRRRLGTSTVPAERLQAERPNQASEACGPHPARGDAEAPRAGPPSAFLSPRYASNCSS